jgi:hypothetical protein
MSIDRSRDLFETPGLEPEQLDQLFVGPRHTEGDVAPRRG